MTFDLKVPVGFADKTRSFLISDATLLILLGLMGVARGVGIARGSILRHPAEVWLSLTVWATVWIVVSIVCLVSSVVHDSPLAAIALALLVGLNAIWASSYIYASIFNNVNLLASAANHAGIALLALWVVWRGTRLEIRVEQEVTYDTFVK